MDKFFYGHVQREGETPTHTFDGVDYVGEVLPKVPDVEGFSYKVVTAGDSPLYGRVYHARLSTSRFVTNANGSEESARNENDCNAKYYSLTNGSWEMKLEGSWAAGNIGDKLEKIVWTSHDIVNVKTNGVSLAASEPIPIPAPVIDPLSMWLGYQAGQWVARQRGKA